MSIWAIIYLCVVAISFGVTISKHGEPKGNYSIIERFFGVGFALFVLYMGGFFNSH